MVDGRLSEKLTLHVCGTSIREVQRFYPMALKDGAIDLANTKSPSFEFSSQPQSRPTTQKDIGALYFVQKYVTLSCL